MSKSINKVFITLFLCLLIVFSSTAFCFNTASADVNKKTSVLQDLANDKNFNINNYPKKLDDFSMDVIHLAEGSSGAVYIYVYQPSGSEEKIVAKGINLCTKDFEHYSLGDFDISSDTPLFLYYDLILVSNKGTLFKYEIKDYNYKEDVNFCTGGEFDRTLDRNYEIAAIYRPYQEGETPLDEEALHSEKGLEVGKCFTVTSLLDGTSAVSVEQTEVITVTDKFVGSMRLKGGFLTFSSDKDVYFVSFKTDKRIDFLLEADVHYCYKSYSHTFGFSKKLVDSGDENVNLNFGDERIWNGGGWFDPVYNWNTIYSMKGFNSWLSTNSKYIVEKDVPDSMSKHDWLLVFADFPYFLSAGSGYGESYMPGSESWTEVSDVAILRLKFVTNFITYNLGVVDDLTTPDRDPDIILDKSQGCKIDLEQLLRLLALIIILILLAPILPFVFSFIITLISLPFKLIGILIKKIKKDGVSYGKKKKKEK